MFCQDTFPLHGLVCTLIGITYTYIANLYFTNLKKRLVIVGQGNKVFSKPINFK
jgi:hypothetical protein